MRTGTHLSNVFFEGGAAGLAEVHQMSHEKLGRLGLACAGLAADDLRTLCECIYPTIRMQRWHGERSALKLVSQAAPG